VFAFLAINPFSLWQVVLTPLRQVKPFFTLPINFMISKLQVTVGDLPVILYMCENLFSRQSRLSFMIGSDGGMPMAKNLEFADRQGNSKYTCKASLKDESLVGLILYMIMMCPTT